MHQQQPRTDSIWCHLEKSLRMEPYNIYESNISPLQPSESQLRQLNKLATILSNRYSIGWIFYTAVGDRWHLRNKPSISDFRKAVSLASWNTNQLVLLFCCCFMISDLYSQWAHNRARLVIDMRWRYVDWWCVKGGEVAEINLAVEEITKRIPHSLNSNHFPVSWTLKKGIMGTAGYILLVEQRLCGDSKVSVESWPLRYNMLLLSLVE